MEGKIPDSPLNFTESKVTENACSLSIEELQRATQDWLFECEYRFQSPASLESKRVFTKNLLWFLNHRGYQKCGLPELRQFFLYLMHGHEEPGGRFGRHHLNRPLRPVSIKDYHTCLRTMFDWFVAEGMIQKTPFTSIPKPKVREDIKAPLSQEQIHALLQAAQKSTAPKKNVAILLLLLDTGCRASECISLQLKDVDLQNRRCTVLGKGNKYRTVFFGRETSKALWIYIREVHRHSDEDAPLFYSARGNQPLTRSGLLQMVERLGKSAGIKGSCSPHALRRSFAVETLKNGANVFSVREMLGHTNIQMTQKYCLLAQTDIETQHRHYSPVDRIKRRGK